MRLYLSWHGWDLFDFNASAKKNHLVNVRVHMLVKREPTPEPKPAAEPESGGFHRGSSLADSSRAGWTPEPDTTTFGFNRRRT